MIESAPTMIQNTRESYIGKELKETWIKEPMESIVQNSMDKIENVSIESLKVQNEELLVEKINAEKIAQIERNREAGANREELANKELQKEFLESKGYKIEREQYLRDKDGSIVKDPLTGEARRIDFVIHHDGKVVKMVEVTSETAPKDIQMAKEDRIRTEGGNYIKERDTGKLVEIPENIKTEVRRYL